MVWTLSNSTYSRTSCVNNQKVKPSWILLLQEMMVQSYQQHQKILALVSTGWLRHFQCTEVIVSVSKEEVKYFPVSYTRVCDFAVVISSGCCASNQRVYPRHMTLCDSYVCGVMLIWRRFLWNTVRWDCVRYQTMYGLFSAHCAEFAKMLSLLYHCCCVLQHATISRNISRLQTFLAGELPAWVWLIGCHSLSVGYWHQRLVRDMATLPQGNQEPLVVKAELAGHRADERHSNPPPR